MMADRAEAGVSVPRNRPSAWAPARELDLAMIGAVDSGGASPDVLREYVLYRRRFARWALDAELVQVLASAGLDARELCARELTARVADLNVCELLQTIAMGRKDATIDLFHGSMVGRIWCTAGEIGRASCRERV